MKPLTMTNQEGGAGSGDQKINVDDFGSQCSLAVSILAELKGFLVLPSLAPEADVLPFDWPKLYRPILC